MNPIYVLYSSINVKCIYSFSHLNSELTIAAVIHDTLIGGHVIVSPEGKHKPMQHQPRERLGAMQQRDGQLNVAPTCHAMRIEGWLGCYQERSGSGP